MTSIDQHQPIERGRAPRARSLAGAPTWVKAPVGFALLASRGIWRAIGPVITVVSVGGWLVLLIAVASLVVGRVLGWQEFVYLAVTLLAGLVCAAVFLFGSAAYAVAIELTPRRVVAGERALGRLVVTGGKRRSTPTRLELPVGSGVAEFVVPALAQGEEGFGEGNAHALQRQPRPQRPAGPGAISDDEFHRCAPFPPVMPEIAGGRNSVGP